MKLCGHHFLLRGFSHIAERLPQHCEYHNTSTCANVFTTFPQRCGNVFATFEYDVEATSGGKIFTTVAHNLSNVPGFNTLQKCK